MQVDLFGNIVDDRDSFEKELSEFDSATFTERLSRFRYFYTYFPDYDKILFGTDESYLIFKEVKSCFINREYVAVLILTLSFIERRFQESLNINGFEKESKESISKILKKFKGNSLISDYFIERVDFLRLKRNPFVHLRDIDDENNLYSRSLVNKERSEKILEKDAKEAIGLMLQSLRIRVL